MQPQLFNFNGQPTLDSREVAEMIGKKHAHLMRDIHRYINDMKPNPNLDPAQFFIESNYKDANGQFRPCYLLTKQGCEFVGNKLTGKKGNLFTVYQDKTFTAGDIAGQLGVSPYTIGIWGQRLGLKAPKGAANRYGYWKNNRYYYNQLAVQNFYEHQEDIVDDEI